mmetsp:Transcript_117973/g.333691  ORF Transcript_117973/g.333691 Transcript_117973/m.333691 type:complete len:238 (+) Transcript_117973:329-1042(+)
MHFLHFLWPAERETSAVALQAVRHPDVVAGHRGHRFGGEGIFRVGDRRLAAVTCGENIREHLPTLQNLLLAVHDDVATPAACSLGGHAVVWHELVYGPHSHGHVDAAGLRHPPGPAHVGELVQQLGIAGGEGVLRRDVTWECRSGLEELVVLHVVDTSNTILIQVVLHVLDAGGWHGADALVARLRDDHADVREKIFHLGRKLDADKASADHHDRRLLLVELAKGIIFVLQVLAPPD